MSLGLHVDFVGLVIRHKGTLVVAGPLEEVQVSFVPFRVDMAYVVQHLPLFLDTGLAEVV